MIDKSMAEDVVRDAVQSVIAKLSPDTGVLPWQGAGVKLINALVAAVSNKKYAWAYRDVANGNPTAKKKLELMVDKPGEWMHKDIDVRASMLAGEVDYPSPYLTGELCRTVVMGDGQACSCGQVTWRLKL